MSAYDLVFAKRWPTLLVDSNPYRVASLVGASVSVVSTVSSVVIISVMPLLLPKETLGPSAATGLLSQNAFVVFLLAVLFVPLFETLIAQLMPLELSRLAKLNDLGCILIGGAVFGLGHYVNGGVLHGISALLAGSLFALSYVTLRPWGYLPAFCASYVAHAAHNGLMLYAVPIIFPSLG